MVEYLSFVLGLIAVICAAIGLWILAIGLWILVGPWLARVILVVVGPAVLLIAGILRAALGLLALCGPWLLLVIVGVIGLAVLPLTGHGATVYVVDVRVVGATGADWSNYGGRDHYEEEEGAEVPQPILDFYNPVENTK